MPGTLLDSGDVTVSNKIWTLLPEDSYPSMEMNNKINKQKKDHNFTLILVLCRERKRTRRDGLMERKTTNSVGDEMVFKLR